MFVKGPKFGRQVGITPIRADAPTTRLNPLYAEDQSSAKHGGGIRKSWTSRVCATGDIMAVMGYAFGRVSAVVGTRRGNYRHEGKRAPLFSRSIRRIDSRVRPSTVATCCASSRIAAELPVYRRNSVITRSGAPESRCFCITAGRSRPHRTWRIIPTHTLQRAMIEGKTSQC
jgi:hypothetical protein